MKQTEILSYTYDFISLLLGEIKIKDVLSKIILFGSVARGDFDEDSDVDLFVEIKELGKEKDVEDLVKAKINSFELLAERTWNLRGVNLPIKVIVGRENDETWENLKDEIKHYGIVLYGEYRENKDNYALISYELSELKQKEKMSFLRRLYGYEAKKNKKVYSKSGLVSSIGAVKTAANQVMVKIEKLREVLKVIKEFKISYKIRKISA